MHTSTTSSNLSGRKQLSSFIIFISAIIILNLCDFQTNIDVSDDKLNTDLHLKSMFKLRNRMSLFADQYGLKDYFKYLDTCVEFMRLMFTNPVRLGKRKIRYILAEATHQTRRRRRKGYRKNHYTSDYRVPYDIPRRSPVMHYRSPASYQIINHYKPSPPTYIDHAEGLYGQYNNAYGRNDGGYQIWLWWSYYSSVVGNTTHKFDEF